MSVSHPYLHLEIGDFIVTPDGDPKYVTDFTYTRYTGKGGDKISFTVYDDTANEIHFKLLNGTHDLHGSYGLSSNDSSKFEAFIEDWSMSFRGWGCTLTIKAVNTINATKNSTSLDNNQASPAEIIKKVIEEEKWKIGFVEEMEYIQHNELPESPEGDGVQVHRRFPRDGQSALEYIQSLLPYCRSQLVREKDGRGKSGFRAYLRGEGKDVRFFCHLPETLTGFEVSHEFTVGAPDSNVVFFNIDTYTYHLRNSRKVKLMYHDSNGNLNVVYAGGPDNLPENVRTIVHVDQDQTHVANVASKEEAQVLADYMWSLKLFATIKAEIEIIDYGKFVNALDRVIVMVYVGPHSTQHYTTGTYFVESVTDTIKDGHIFTKLSLGSRQV